ncbi:hypothetical protein [Paraburkholderia sp. BR10882]|uniref:hypothetical protein n=1 Tax=unclassified Paraburkholderia TaxID=2615204 RepID=UPI0034CDBB09
MGSAAVEDSDLRDNPLKVVWNGKALATDAVFGQSHGDMPRANDVRMALLASATLRSSPDPDDEVRVPSSYEANLTIEVKREIKVRIGQGRFRAALLQLHDGCMVTEVTEADDVTLTLQTDSNGNLIVDSAGNPVLCTLYGDYYAVRSAGADCTAFASQVTP